MRAGDHRRGLRVPGSGGRRGGGRGAERRGRGGPQGEGSGEAPPEAEDKGSGWRGLAQRRGKWPRGRRRWSRGGPARGGGGGSGVGGLRPSPGARVQRWGPAHGDPPVPSSGKRVARGTGYRARSRGRAPRCARADHLRGHGPRPPIGVCAPSPAGARPPRSPRPRRRAERALGIRPPGAVATFAAGGGRPVPLLRGAGLGLCSARPGPARRGGTCWRLGQRPGRVSAGTARFLPHRPFCAPGGRGPDPQGLPWIARSSCGAGVGGAGLVNTERFLFTEPVPH